MEIPNELVPIPVPVSHIPGRRSNATCELLFKADNLPQLGLKSYHIEKVNGNGDSLLDYNSTQNITEDVYITNGVIMEINLL